MDKNIEIMTIEEGKRYVRKDGLITGRLTRTNWGGFADPNYGIVYTIIGKYDKFGSDHAFLSHEFIEVEKHKYWLITYRRESMTGGKMYLNKILDNVHPFVFIANQDKDYDWLLWQFQEITEEEFQLNLNILNGSKQLHGIPIFYLKPEDSIKENVITFESKWSNEF